MRELGNEVAENFSSDVVLNSIFNSEVLGDLFSEEETIAMGLAMANVNKSGVSALSGYAYLGQLLAHDLSRLRKEKHSIALETTQKDVLISTVTAKLDLGCIYEPAIGSYVQKNSLRVPQSAKMRVGPEDSENSKLHKEYDLPRDVDGIAVIADDRNDENVIVSQLHVQFLKLHNYFVEKIALDEPEIEIDNLFEAAKEQTILHYQEVILYDLLYEIIHPDVWKAIVLEDRHILWKPKSAESGAPTEHSVLPIEFTGAAARFGHAMVRNSYALNKNQSITRAKLFEYTGAGGFNSLVKRLPSSHIIDWVYFFDFPTIKREAVPDKNSSSRISPGINITLKHTSGLEDPKITNLARRNLKRGAQLLLGSGQTIVRHLNNRFSKQLKECGITVRELTIDELNLNFGSSMQNVLKDHCPNLQERTPLWYYVMAEACLQTHQRIGKLGPLGSLILAESIKRLLKLNLSILTHPEKKRDYISATKIVEESQDRRFLQMSDLILAVNPGLPNPVIL